MDPIVAARHRAFIAPRVVFGAFVTAALPVYLLLRGAPSVIEIVALSFFIVPLACAYMLSRTGRFELVHLLNAAALALLLVVIAALSGGLASTAAVLLALVPLEAATTASRRTALGAILIAGIGLVSVVALHVVGAVAPAPSEALGTLTAASVAAGLIFAGVLAMGANRLSQLGAVLRNAEDERYRLLASNMTDVITRHGPKGATLFVSPAAERVVGLEPDSLLGQGLFDRVHIADRPAYLSALADAAAGHARSVEFRLRRGALTEAGRPYFLWIEMRARALPRPRNDDTTSCDVVAIMRDVTERKLHDEELARLHAEAEQANAAKGRFLATMSHELRTPLNAVIGFSEMLIHETTMQLDPACRLEYARLIHESGHHLLSVVNCVLDMSKIESGRFVITPEPFAPGSVIRSCCDLLALRAREAGLDVIVDLPSALPELNADKRALKQVLINLLSNAVKFTERGGHISVTASAQSEVLTISVEDTGVGISAEDLPRIGDPFFQARSSYDRPYEGTGLGLSIVKGLVGLHNGAFDITSEPGRGTRVTVRLPLDCEKKIDVSRIVALPVAATIEPGGSVAPVRNQEVRKSA